MTKLSALRLPIGLLGCALGIGVPTVLGSLWSQYSPLSNFLSELGATGAPHAAIMNYAVFLTVGVLWALGVYSLLALGRSKLLLIGVLMLLGTSVSYIGSAFFPCDAGCPLEGSETQTMHNVLGIIGYLTSPIGFALIGAFFVARNEAGAGVISFVVSFATALGFVMMMIPEMEEAKGAWQRLADFSMFVWLLVISILLRGKDRRTAEIG